MARRPDLGFFEDGLNLLDRGTYAPAMAPFGQAHSLPAAAFRSLEYALLEDEAIWTRDWVCIGTLADIPEAGDVLPFTVGNHGIHVQRMADGSLEGRFNNAQHGGCRFVPVQCQGGTKTKCSFTSCGYSRDRDAMAAADGGISVAAMHQYLGLRPERLLRISVATSGPLILVNIDGPGRQRPDDPELATGIALALAGKPARSDKHWLEFDGNWKRVGQALTGADAPQALSPDAIATTRASRDGVPLSALWLFPNLVILSTAAAACTIVLQQTALEKTLCRVQVWTGTDAAMASAAAASLLHTVDAAGETATAAQKAQLPGPFSQTAGGAIQSDAVGHWAQTAWIGRVLAMPVPDARQPMFQSTQYYSI